MKSNRSLLSILIVCIFILASCSNNNDINAHISSIKSAVKKFTKLDNGKFTYRTIVESNIEKHSQVTEGIFSVQDDYIDWHTKLILSESNSNVKTVNEILQKDKVQYNRFGMINKDNEFIDSDNKILPKEPEWQKVHEDATGYPDYLKSLIKLELNKEDIQKAKVKKVNNVNTYEFTYNDSFINSMKHKNISIIKEQLDNARKQNTESNEIRSLEDSLSYNENINYNSIKLIVTVDETGVLVGKDLESVYEIMDNDKSQTSKMTESLEIGEYNQTNLNIER